VAQHERRQLLQRRLVGVVQKPRLTESLSARETMMSAVGVMMLASDGMLGVLGSQCREHSREWIEHVIEGSSMAQHLLGELPRTFELPIAEELTIGDRGLGVSLSCVLQAHDRHSMERMRRPARGRQRHCWRHGDGRDREGGSSISESYVLSGNVDLMVDRAHWMDEELRVVSRVVGVSIKLTNTGSIDSWMDWMDGLARGAWDTLPDELPRCVAAVARAG